VETKHKVFLWIVCLIFVSLVLGKFQTTTDGAEVFRISTNGAASSVLFFVATLLITRSERTTFFIGAVLWILSILALLFMSQKAFVVIHF
jgi:hypothetical protein